MENWFRVRNRETNETVDLTRKQEEVLSVMQPGEWMSPTDVMIAGSGSDRIPAERKSPVSGEQHSPLDYVFKVSREVFLTLASRGVLQWRQLWADLVREHYDLDPSSEDVRDYFCAHTERFRRWNKFRPAPEHVSDDHLFHYMDGDEVMDEAIDSARRYSSKK